VNKTLGLLGAGRTARLLAVAGRRRGLDCIFLDPEADAGTAELGRHILADWNDAAALQELGRRADLVNVDAERVPGDAANRLQSVCRVYPPAKTLTVSQDRWQARRLMQSLRIPSVPCRPVASRPQLLDAVEQFGFPCVLKTRRPVTDGKRQAILRFREDLERAWQQLGDCELICEPYFRCDAEYAVIVVRGSDGQYACWPLTRTLHRNGALAVTMAPVLEPGVQARAEALAGRLFAHLEQVGVGVLEFFSAGGALIANEYVPGPHDSANWTIDGASVSQFDNHLHALCGTPLADTGLEQRALTFNLAAPLPGETVRRDSPAQVYWHDFHMGARAGCKLGHVTVVAKSEAGLRARAAQLAGLLGVGAELDLEAILD